MVAGVVAVLGSGESEVAVLVQSGRVERAGWWKWRRLTECKTDKGTIRDKAAN